MYNLLVARQNPQASRCPQPIFVALIVLVIHATSLAAPVAPQTVAPSSPGYWLLDLAWNQAGNLTSAPNKADATEVLCLLQAATRLDPKLAEAWQQQYDLLKSLGRNEEAVEALRKYTQLSPEDEPALMMLAAEEVGAGQTAEKRLAACQEWLARKGLPEAVTSYLLRIAAEINHNRLQDDRAIKDVQRAVSVFPYDIAAQRMLVDLQKAASPADDLNLDLWTLRANPADVGTMMDIGRLADGLGLYADAAQWYRQAQTLLTHFKQDTTNLNLQMADHWLSANQPDEAVKLLLPLRTNPQVSTDVNLLLAEAYTTQGEAEKARDAAMVVARQATTQPATASGPAASSPAEMHAAALTAAQAHCQNSWVRMMYLGAAEDAQAAEAVFQASGDQSWARRCYGWALLKANQFDKAVEILQPIAGTDTWAALGLAEAYKGKNDTKAAEKALQQLQQLSPAGPAYRAAARWASSAGLAMPAADAAMQQRVKVLLAGFDRTLLNLPLEPGKFLKLKLTMDTPPVSGKSWFGRIELTNAGTQPIYCGPYGAVSLNVMLSAMVYDPGSRDIGQRLLVSLNKQFILKPGQTVSLYRPLDSGPLHQLLLNPYKTAQVMFTAILDPVRMSNGVWMPGPMGLLTEPLSANRIANQPPRADELLRQARTGSQEQKIDVLRWIACIVVGKQGREGSQTQPALAPQSPLTQAMVALLGDRDPIVVAHALSCPDETPLIEPIFQAAMPHVNDANWLTRLMAVRFFAHEQGGKFTRALKGLSQTDPDPIVRSLMAAYYGSTTAAVK